MVVWFVGLASTRPSSIFATPACLLEAAYKVGVWAVVCKS